MPIQMLIPQIANLFTHFPKCLLRGRSQLSTFMYSYRAYGGGGGGRGHDVSVLFLNVDILLMLPPGGYD